MVTWLFAFRRTGLSDWVIQRLSAVILLSYFVFISFHLLGPIDYASWSSLHHNWWMKVFTLVATLSLAAHAWIGLWSVFTDYLTERLLGAKATILRRICEFGASVSLLGYIIWAFIVVWN